MKYLIQIAITGLILLCSNISTAQNFQKDSISVKIEDKIAIKMSIYDYDDLKKTVDEDLKQLQTILKENQNISENKPYTISYEPYKKLTIKDADETETIIFENGEYSPYKFANRCEIQTEAYRMTIDFNAIEDLLSEDVINKMNEAIDSTVADNTRYSTLFNYTFDKNELLNFEKDAIGWRSDFLFLKAGVGANLIKNDLVIDLTGEIGIGLNKKGIIKNQYYVSYNLLYDFIDNSSADLNGFLNVGYRHNFSNDPDDDTWIGLEFGYLVNQEGDMFDDNTFRVGLNWEAGSSITISPQLYVSSEQTFPGLRIGFGF